MNIFGIVALVAFALCAGSALWEKKRQRAGYEARIKGLNENILKLAGERNSAQEDCRALQKQLDTLSKDNLMLIDRMHGVEAERDALRAQLADGHAAPRKRASRAKPPATQE